MPFVFAYLLKLSVSLALVYLFYRLVLRKLTFYNWNRWYLLGYTVLSFFLAVINITPSLEKSRLANNDVVKLIPSLEMNGTPAPVTMRHAGTVVNAWSVWNWVFAVLLIGMCLLVLRLCLLYVSFYKVKRQAVLLSKGSMKLYHVDRDIIPFSFGNSIFINRRLHNESELQEIIRHEFVHVKQKHTHDIIWSELLCIINWYNPFAWLIRSAVRQNLEFIADDKVVSNGIDKKQYQYLLLKVIGNNHFSIANQFNFSSLKKRIAMMNKMRSARAHLLKFLFILPLAAVLLLAFRSKTIGAGSNDGLQLLLQEHSSVIAIDTPPPPPPVPPTARLPKNVKSINVTDNKALVTLKDGTKESYDLDAPEEKARYEKKYGKLPAPPPPPMVLPEGTPAWPAPPTPPPPPPPAIPATSKMNNVVDVNVNNNFAVVTLKDGTYETYDLNSAEGKAKYEKKYDKLPEPPQPPVVAPLKVSVSESMPVSVSVDRNMEPVTTATTVTASSPVKVKSNVRTSVFVSPSATQAVDATVSVSPVVTTTVNEKVVIELKFHKYTTRAGIDKLIEEAKDKGIELNFEKIKYNSKNELVSLAGTMKKGASTNTFDADDFEMVTLLLIKTGDDHSFRVVINRVREDI